MDVFLSISNYVIFCGFHFCFSWNRQVKVELFVSYVPYLLMFL